MKRSTKVLSALLAAVLIITSAYVGIVAAAQDIDLEQKYDELADLLASEYVKDLSNYSTKSETDEDDLVPYGGYKVYVTVTARDNLNGDIARAAEKFYEIANIIKSTEYGVGYYNALMIINAVKEELAKRMGDKITVMEPYRAEIPVQKEVTVFVEDPNNPGTYIETTEIRTVMETVTLYKPVEYERYRYYNVPEVLSYFIGEQTGVSVVNWFYDYSFEVKTDIDEALMAFDSVEDLPYRINVKYVKFTWKYARIAAENNTSVYYVLSDIIREAPEGAPYNYAETSIQIALQQAHMRLFGATSNLLTTDYTGYTADQLLAVRNSVKDYVVDLLRHSDRLLVHFFGDKLSNLMNWYYSTEIPIQYPITREVKEGVTYSANLQRLNQAVDKIDALFLSPDVGTILKSFIDTTDDKYKGSPMYGVKYNNAKELVEVLLKDFIFRDNIVTSIFLMLYPMVYEMLADMNSDVPILDLFNELRGEGIYLQFQYVRDRLPAKYQNIKNHMNAAISQGYVKDANSWAGFEEYVDSLPKGNKLNWGVDEAYDQKTAFINAVAAIFAPVEPLLWTLFGDVKFYIEVVGRGAYASIQRMELYQKLIIPLFETLGIKNFITYDQFKPLRSHTDIMNAILGPIIDWVLNDVASKPITALTSAIPNLSMFLTSQNGKSPVQSIIDSVEVYLEAKVAGITVYTMEMPFRDLLSDYYPYLGGGLNGVLNLVSEMSGYDEEEEDEGFNIDYLPPILDAAIQARGQIVRNKTFPSGSMTRDFVVVYDPSAGIDYRGQVLFALLRWVFTGINSRNYNYSTGKWADKTLLESFGLTIDDIDAELADMFGMPAGSRILSETIGGIAIHPNDVILAILELMFPKETGKFPTDGTYSPNPYVYPMQELTYSPEIVAQKSFGNRVQYNESWTKEKAEYLAAATPIMVERLLKALKIEGINSVTDILEDMLVKEVFTQEMLTKIALMIYPMITELNIDSILSVALGLDYSPKTIAQRMAYLNNRADRPASEVQLALENVAREDWHNNAAYSNVYNKWNEALLFEHEFVPYIETIVEVNPETGEATTKTQYNHIVVPTGDRPLDWGFEDGDRAAWLDNLVALLSPFADILQVILADRNLNLINLIDIPGYAGYQYSIIPLLEALGCDNIKTYAQYKAALSNPITGPIDTFYLILNPLIGLFDRIMADPMRTILNILPNLMYFISIGGLNVVINNLLHFVYVFADVIKPIVNAYPIVNALLDSLRLNGMSLGLTIPVDINVNYLMDRILFRLVGDGIPIGDSNMKLNIKLPSADITMLVAGEPIYYEDRPGKQMSKTQRPGVILIQGNNGAELLTVLLKYAFSVLFYSDNADEIGRFVSEYFSLNEEDTATLFEVLRFFNSKLNEMGGEYMAMSMLYTLVSTLFPYTEDLVKLFENSQYGLMDVIGELPNVFEGDTSGLMLIINDIRAGQPQDPNSTLTLFGRIIQILKDFFAKVQLFFSVVFNR